MKRTAVREHVFRILFRYDFYDKEDFGAQAALYFDNYPDYREEPREDGARPSAADKARKDHVPTELDRAEIISRACDAASHIEELDGRIGSVCEGWRLERIGKAELTILRLAAYEILYDDAIQPPVAINEAVELSKKYCEAKSHSFVNGVLAKLVKSLGTEPAGQE